MFEVRRNSLHVLLSLSVFLTSCGGGGGGDGGGNSTGPVGGLPVTKLAANGPVSAVAVGKDGTTYIGGNFSQIGPVTGGYVPLDSTTGLAPASFPIVTGSVYTSAADGNGGWYIGGSFNYVAGVVRNKLAHIKADGTLDLTFNPNPNDDVNVIVVSGSTIYVGGSFTQIDNIAQTAVAALNSSGKATNWLPTVTGGWVKTLAVDNNVVYLGGTFTGVNTVARNRLAAVDLTGNLVPTWNPNANGDVTALGISNSIVFVGGTFTKIGTADRDRLAAIDTSGLLRAWNPDADSSVSTLFVSGNTIYVGGNFMKIGTVDRHHIAAIDATLDNSNKLIASLNGWDPDVDGMVSALSMHGNLIYIGGLFSTISNTSRNNLAVMDTSGNLGAWNPSAGHQVTSLAVSDDGQTVFAGGTFTSIGGTTRNNLAAIDAAGNLTSWNPGVNGSVSALAVNDNDDTVYVGGNYSSIGQSQSLRNSLAAVATADGTVTDWDPNVTGGSVYALAVSGNTVYAGGDFTSIKAASQKYLAAIDAAPGTVGTLSDWNPNIVDANGSGSVAALSVSGSTVFIGGKFTSVLNTSRTNLAAVDNKILNGKATAILTNWNPQPNGKVLTMAVANNVVFAGGNFNKVGIENRNYLAAIDATPDAMGGRMATLLPWNPNANGGVLSMSLSGNTLYIGGGFTRIGNITRSHLAAVTVTGALQSWSPDASDTVSTVGVSGSNVYVGGLFRSIGSEPYSRFVGLTR